MKSENHNYYYDSLRIIAMFMVIGLHSIDSTWMDSPIYIYKIVANILRTLFNLGVPIFLGLSGILLLRREYIGNVKEFYILRSVRILIPYFIYSVIYVTYEVGIENSNFSEIPSQYFIKTFTGNVHGTWWFISVIIGLYFSTPYLAKMFSAMSDKEVKILYFGTLGYILINDMLLKLNYSLGVSNIVFSDSYLLYFISGYCISRITKKNESKKILNWLFIIALIIIYNNLFKSSFVVSLIIGSLLLLFNNISLGDKKNRIIRFISKYSFTVYLIHASVLSLMLRCYTQWYDFYFIKLFFLMLIVFVLSLVIVFIIDNIITINIQNTILNLTINRRNKKVIKD